ncbi:MAG: signal peptidase I [Actinomycetota bacterium]
MSQDPLEEPSGEEGQDENVWPRPGTADDGGPPRRPKDDRSREHLIALVLEFAVLFIIALVIAIYLQAFAIKPFMIPSPSMEPTLQEGDRVLVDRMTYHFREPRRGEVIVFRFDPNDTANWTQGSNGLTRSLDLLAEILNITHQESLPFIKRVVGVGGDTVELRDGVLFVNGEPYEAGYEYVKDNDNGKWEVPEGTVMVMGDNRPNSNDSRRWGFVPLQAVIGRGVLVWWPPSRWSTL